jgi:hypothetical protein
LLDDVGQLVAEEAPAFVGARLPAAGCEADVASGGEGIGAQAVGGLGLRVDAHRAQVGLQAILEIAPFVGRERQAGAQGEPGGGGLAGQGACLGAGRGLAFATGDALGALLGGAVTGDRRHVPFVRGWP